MRGANVKYIRKEIRRQITQNNKRQRGIIDMLIGNAKSDVDLNQKKRFATFMSRMRWLFTGK